MNNIVACEGLEQRVVPACVAADGKAIQSFATKISEKDSRNRGERDANWCKKEYTTTKEDGEKIVKTKNGLDFVCI